MYNQVQDLGENRRWSRKTHLRHNVGKYSLMYTACSGYFHEEEYYFHCSMVCWRFAIYQVQFYTIIIDRIIAPGRLMQSPPSAVCPSICFCSKFWTEWSLTLTFCACISHDHSFPEFEGQGQRSRSNVEMQSVGLRATAILVLHMTFRCRHGACCKVSCTECAATTTSRLMTSIVRCHSTMPPSQISAISIWMLSFQWATANYRCL